MPNDDEQFTCGHCETVASRAETIRSETMGGLDPTVWQTLCCPTCGRRLRTVFVGAE